TGEPNDPFKIATAADWQELMAATGDWGRHFLLTADLDMNGVAMTPVGNSSTMFTGIFDGNGHIIRNVDINTPSKYYVGLFGYVGSYVHIRNVGIEDAAISGRDYVGGLVGSDDGPEGYSGCISDCYVTGSITGDDYVGGIIGLSGGSYVLRCYATVVVDGHTYVGGLFGFKPFRFLNCYAAGPVSGDEHVGGLTGIDSYGGGFWDVNVSGQPAGSDVRGKTTAEMKDKLTYLPSDWDFTTDDHDPAEWVMPENDYPRLAWEYWKAAKVPDVNGVTFEQAGAGITGAGLLVGTLTAAASETVPPGCIIQQSPLADSNGIQGLTKVDMVISCRTEFADGNGTYDDPYRIGKVVDWMQLTDTPECWDRHFVVTDDLDFFGGGITPVSSSAQPFDGVLDGSGHTIRNLIIDAPVNYSGLFGALDSNGCISDLRVERIHVVVQEESFPRGGGLLGNNYGTVVNCSVSGWVDGEGGLIGRHGGLVGSNRGTITCSCADTWISVSEPSNTGGLAGWNTGTITDCYATGFLSWGGAYTGGLIGGGGNYGSITNCYSTSKMTYRSSGVGGLVGDYDGGSIGAAYFLDPNDGGGPDNGYGEPLTDIQMRQQVSFVGWDFVGAGDGDEDIWSICEGMAYPRLTWQAPAADFLCPDGVTARDFSFFAQHWQRADCNSANEYCDRADIDGSGRVDGNDLALFAEQWLEQADLMGCCFWLPAPPSQAANPDPLEGAITSTSTNLSWWRGECAVSHNVYFGTANPPEFRGSQASVTFEPGPLELGTTYYWRIDEVNSHGTTTGKVWSFTTCTGSR
ncbi:MAG: hypothetical protein JW720_14810, partial [Sedimentisphaerales bacterium]|nr:hypothetical protein [Sedimentisphaerales bacterium]